MAPSRLYLLILAKLIAVGVLGRSLGYAEQEGAMEYNISTSYEKIMNDSFEKILTRYAFVSDFDLKAPERSISTEIFWKYNMRLPKVDFPIPEQFDEIETMVPATEGSNREVEHVNYGRVLILKGKYDAAKKVLLEARRIPNLEDKLKRRIHYFIGVAYLRLAHVYERKLGIKHPDVRNFFSNASNFLGVAYKKPLNVTDKALDKYGPHVLYTLAAIYHNYGRFRQAFETSNNGLNYLRKTGEKTYRHSLRRILAESLILNQTYDSAVREIDVAIRQDPNALKAATDFARVGDVYFGLNNYEIAEEVYALSIAIDRELALISSQQAILRGESLFWLGRFDEAEKMLEYGTRGSKKKNNKHQIDDSTYQYAKLRIADIYLHRASVNTGELKEKFLKMAKLRYYRLSHRYVGSEAANVAKMRLTCLDLPTYKGFNVKHARQFLEGVKVNFAFPPVAQELAMACYVSSFTQRERTNEMLEKVKDFAENYPDSKFLQSMIEPVKEVKSSYLDKLFKAKKYSQAVKFYEKNKSKLFTKGIKLSASSALFNEYFRTGEIGKAKSFWKDYKKYFTKKNKLSGLEIPYRTKELIRRLTFLEEVTSIDKSYEKELKDFTDYVMKQDNLDFSKTDEFLLTRIKLVDHDLSALSIILKQVNEVARLNIQGLCEKFAPTVSKFLTMEKSDQNIDDVEKTVRRIIEGNYVSMSSAGLDCAESLLDLEFKIYQKKKDLSSYTKNWLKRLDWPLNKQVLAHLWQASEMMEKKLQLQSASKIWKHIQENGPEGAIEVKMSTSRLEKQKTALERLWK